MDSIPAQPHVIYALTDPNTHEVRYIGRAKDLTVRLKRHWRGLGRSHVAKWISALKRHGQRPGVTVLQTVSASCICNAERYWIAHYRALGCPLTNIGDGGEGGMPGAKHSEETKAKIGAAHRGKIVSAEARARMSEAQRRAMTQERRAEIGAASRNRSPEANARIGEANRGRSPSEETRAKISAASKGRPQSEEARRKRSEALKGRKKSPEHIEKLRQARIGRPQSPEQVEKRIQKVKATWERKRQEKLSAD